MKTYLTYGFATAFVGALVNFAFYFAGYHSDPAKMVTALNVARIVGLVTSITCIILGTRARRRELPPTEAFGYGAALGSGVMIVLFAAIFAIGINYLYISVINPGFTDTLVQAQLQQMEAKGFNATQLERAETGIRWFMQPVIMAVFVFLQIMFFGTIISLITAAFLKRSSTSESPPIAT